MIPLNAAAQAQVIILAAAAVLAGLFALLGVLHHLLGEGWWRRLRRSAAPHKEQDQT